MRMKVFVVNFYRILRCACEFIFSSTTVDRIRFKRLSYFRLIEQCFINAKNQHHQDEYRLVLVNLLNDIESLASQGKLSIDNELNDIFVELIRFLNIHSLGQTVLNSYQNYFLDWIRHSQNSITMLSLFVSVCQTLKDRNRKILFIEIILYIYIIYDQEHKWSIIFNLFEQSEDVLNIKIDDYLQLCCEYNTFLTLYLYSEYQFTHSKHEDILYDELKYLEKLIDLFTNGKIRIIHGEEERVLLLMIKINQIIMHQLEYGKSMDALLIRLIRKYAHWLITIGTDNKEYNYGGLFAMIGIGKKAQYSLR